MKAWRHQYVIAGVVVQIASDSAVCEQDMLKFLKLYEQVEDCTPHLTFCVTHQSGVYTFVCRKKDGEQDVLWTSHDATEVSAALEIHLYSQLVQILAAQDIASIHSAVLNINDKAVMFAGVSGAGKSSICTAGLLDGAPYLSDEFTLLDKHGDVHPFPRPMQWEYELHPAFDRKRIQQSGLIDADYFDFPSASGGITRCHLWHPTNIQSKPLALQHIVLHGYAATHQAAELIEIPRYEALSALPEHLHVQQGMAKDLPMLNQRISQTCRFYRLPFSDVFAAWAKVKNEVLKPL